MIRFLSRVWPPAPGVAVYLERNAHAVVAAAGITIYSAIWSWRRL